MKDIVAVVIIALIMLGIGFFTGPFKSSATTTATPPPTLEEVSGPILSAQYHSSPTGDPQNSSTQDDSSNPGSVVTNITVGLYPVGITYDPSNGYIYVTNLGSGTVSVINPQTNTVIANISVGGSPIDIVYDPSNGYLYVTNYASGVNVIATSSSSSATSSTTPPTTTFSPPSTLIILGVVVVVVAVVGFLVLKGRRR